MPVEVSGIKLNRVHKIVTLEQGAFVYHHIPGLEGNVVQDLGRDSVRLQIDGIFYGSEAQDGLEGLREVYKAREPVDFLAEVIGQAYFGQVILERFEVSQLAGEPDQFSYSLVVTEYVKPPEPATAAAASVEQAIKLDADTFMEMATLPDMLSLGAVPELTNPVVPLTGALDPITAAVDALQSATEALTRLFEQDGDGGTPPDIPPEWGAHPPTPLDWGPSPDGRDGQPIGLNGQPLGADGALRDRDGQPILGPHGELLGPDGQPLLGPNGELLGPDGQPLRGPNGTLLGAQGELLRPDGAPVLGPNGALLDADGNPLLGPDGELLGPDGQALLDDDGQPLGPDGQPIDIARLTIALLDEASAPVPGAAYALTLGAQEVEHGWLNMQGQVQIKGLKTETDYSLTLADFDGLEAVTVRTGWVVIALTDEDGTPVASVWYVLSLADGSTREGTLDAAGQAALAELEPGLTYRLSFPDYALTAWDLVEARRPPTVQTGWVMITLMEEAGAPVPGGAYVLSLADGSTREGMLDTTGQALLEDLAPGLVYRLSFPAYNLTTWGRVEELPRPVLRPGWVAITLMDEAGDPVPRVRYVRTLADGSTQEGWLDATGQALLAGLEPGLAYRLSFPEVAPAAWRSTDEVQVPVVQPGWVAITLVDEMGAPVPGVRYVFTLLDGSAQEGWLNAAGQAVLEGFEPGLIYRLTFPDHDLRTWSSLDEGQAEAARPGWVALALGDEAGTSIAGAVYVLTLADGSTHVGTLDADGQAVITALEAGLAYHLSFLAYDLTAWGQIDDLEAAAPQLGWVQLALVDEANLPVARVTYVLTLADGSTREGMLDADGRAVIAALEPGVVYSLSFLDYDRTTWNRVEERPPALSLPGWVTIALVDEAGAPVAAAVYVLTLADGSTCEGVLNMAGQAVLSQLAVGVTYHLNFPAYDVTAWGRVEELPVAPTQSGWIGIVCVDEGGAPRAGAAYALTLADGSTREGTLDADGQALLLDLEPGASYHLSCPAYDLLAWGRVEAIQAVVPSDWVALALVEETGAPVAGAAYVLTLADGSTQEGGLDAAGQVVITDLEPGIAYHLSFPDYDVTAWRQVEERQVVAPSSGWVRLALVDEEDMPVAGAVYVLTLADGSTRTGKLDAEGQAVVADLAPGVVYHLSFPTYDRPAWERVEDTQAAAAPGWVALAMRDEVGAPVVGVLYVLTLADGSTRTGTLDAAGEAVLAELVPGMAYHLSFPDYDHTVWGWADAVRAAEPRPGWVTMTLVDETGAPMVGAAYVLTLADGSTRTGTLDTAGQALLEDLEPGQAYGLSFPQVAAIAWSRDDGQAAETPPGWIAMTVADEAGVPMAGAAYVLTLADGSTSEGWLDADGQAILVGLEPGQVYRLSFPEYDGADWDLARG